MNIQALFSIVAFVLASKPQTPVTTSANAPSTAPLATSTTQAQTFIPDITYRSIPREGSPPIELKLNIARPADLKPGELRPCIVAIHGGGWAAGKREELNFLITEAAKQGFVGATVSYRLAPAFRFPAQIEDCAAAVRFLKENASTYGIDPDRIGAIGFSAGAHLAMLLAVAGDDDGLGIKVADTPLSGRVRATVAFFGPTEIYATNLPPSVIPVIAGLIGSEDVIDGVSRAERARRASPVTYVSPGDSPILMFYGTKDQLVPYAHASKMLDAMTKAGVSGRAEIIANEGHGFTMPELTRSLKDATEFLRENLTKPAPAHAQGRDVDSTSATPLAKPGPTSGPGSPTTKTPSNTNK